MGGDVGPGVETRRVVFVCYRSRRHGTGLLQAIFYLMASVLLVTVPARGDAGDLPAPADVARITIEPHDGKLKDFFTPESLLLALSHLRRTEIGRTLAFGKVWLWQKGIIHLKDGRQIPWRSFADNLILFDADEGPVVYTDIDLQSHFYGDGKIITTIYTWQGQKEVAIDTR